jgi:hypothetical protein
MDAFAAGQFLIVSKFKGQYRRKPFFGFSMVEKALK